ncbi:PQQ-dependent dehydrogenase, methanol/ethanol family [Bradyrhizobium brasilense]|uniref:PQQ-dependent dehydrogenase, methanol/ethanol family n=1 Tax=Bradyrhizobium brasilense TaxID=1419277 RepID=UPI001E43EC55|nr:PQQ-dependent dehydrogenase, methanol/ethanol family [Bradyrhizobium brasilense]MCC8972637.1 PQQ-dependent dehydrogenase, methanol/ethanol family [Bradyrhizobium brasilense]
MRRIDSLSPFAYIVALALFTLPCEVKASPVEFGRDEFNQAAAELGLPRVSVKGETSGRRPESFVVTPEKIRVSDATATPRQSPEVDEGPYQWTTGGRDWRQSYDSPLKQINKANVARLGHAWSSDVEGSSWLEATPIVVDDVMYVSSISGIVYALNAETGQQLWRFDPGVASFAPLYAKACCGPNNRGVAFWKGHVYVAAFDGTLYALDAKTGGIIWRADTIADRSRGYTSTGAPYIAGDLVVIGNAGAELDARGYISAYDIETGALAWRFFTVPGNPLDGFEHPELKMAAETWDKDSRWDVGLGGTAFDGMAYDPELDLLYVGTGNGGPWPRTIRSPRGGDNLFLSSILAISPKTGRLKWYYQTTPGDSWDYTATQKMILADLRIRGKVRKVIMQAPKNGFFYVLDRATGELLSARPYLRKLTWASRVDMKTGRPIESDQAQYWKSPRLIFPAATGGHNWQPMAFNRQTGLVYVPVREAGDVYALSPEPFSYNKSRMNYHVNLGRSDANGHFFAFCGSACPGLEEVLKVQRSDILKGQPDVTPRSFLRAMDPVSGKIEWEAETTLKTRYNNRVSYPGGVMSTAGELVFEGYVDGTFDVRNARDGTLLKSIFVENRIWAAPMTYLVRGVQYVAFLASDRGDGAKSRIVALRLDGDVVPPPTQSQNAARGESPASPSARTSQVTDPKLVNTGRQLFEQNCATCHVGGNAPSLTPMQEAAQRQFFDIVLGGIRANKGMGNFSAILSGEDAAAIRTYLINAGQEKDH